MKHEHELAVGVIVLILVLILYEAQSMSSGSDSSAIDKWALAIQQHEGFYAGSVSNRNNNPGNLKGKGDVGTDPNGFAIYSSYDAGFNALVSDLNAKVNKYPDYSLLQIMTRYLGGDPNDPKVTNQGDPFAYARAVANALGASVSDSLAKVFGG